jgi:hypothetical protein
MLWIAIVVLLSLVGSPAALAHSWYDPVCCSGRDCAPVPFDSVEVTVDGYRVTLHPGDHLMVRSSVVHLVAYGDVLESQDDSFHACLFPDQHVMRCFYAPPFGS